VRRRVLVFVGLLPILATACATYTTGPGERCWATPVPVAELPDPLQMQGRMRFPAASQPKRFEFVAERQGDTITVVGFSNVGMRLFAAQLVGDEVQVTQRAPRKVAPPVEHIVDVLQRAFWIEPPFEAPPNGTVTWDRGGEQVIDSMVYGRRAGRVFADPAGDIGADERVQISYPLAPNAPISVSNPWCGYSARVVLKPVEVPKK
jgi:hypothetical protein